MHCYRWMGKPKDSLFHGEKLLDSYISLKIPHSCAKYCELLYYLYVACDDIID